MLHTMTRNSSALLVLAVASFASFSVACSKEKKDEPAVADAAVAVEVAPAAVADAAVAVDASEALDAAPAPLATTVAPRPTPKAPAPEPPICASARTAKKRGSPAAPSLEAQCRAAGGTP
jgi:hypothetical protein